MIPGRTRTNYVDCRKPRASGDDPTWRSEIFLAPK